MTKPRFWLQLSCLVTAVVMCLAQQHTGKTTQEQVNICTFIFQGRADSHIAVESASITCTGRQRVPLTIASMLRAFSANFTGVDITVDASLAVASTSDSPTTALVAMHNISLVVANSKFEGLHVTMDTLLLFVNSSITLQNTTFTDNQAPFAGAVAATSMRQLTVSHSTFTSNVGRFGAIHVKAGPQPASATEGTVPDMVVESCHFQQNKAHVAQQLHDGAAITSHAPSTVIANSTFIANDGAVRAHPSSTSVVVSGCTFRTNKGASGAAVSFNASMEDGISKRLAVFNSTLESNGAVYGGAIFGGDGLQAVSLDTLQVKSNLGLLGGAICLKGEPDVNITSCEFSFNEAYFLGGAVYLASNSTQDQQGAPQQLFISSKFHGNMAVHGGGVYIGKHSCNITVQDSTFVENIATLEFDTDVTEALQMEVGQPIAGSESGGAIAVQSLGIVRGNLELHLRHSVFSDNWSSGTGGAVSALGFQSMLAESCSFTNNTATSNLGGAIQLFAVCQTPNRPASIDPKEAASFATLSKPVSWTCQAGFTDNVFLDNTAVAGGAAFLALDGFVAFMVNTTFRGNQADTHAGAVYIGPVADNAPGTIVLISEVLFQDNVCIGDEDTSTPGGLYLDEVLCASISNSTFDHNVCLAGKFSVGALTVWRASGKPEVCYHQVETQKGLPAAFKQQPALFDPLRNLQNSMPIHLQPTSVDLRHVTLTNNIGSMAAGVCIIGNSINNVTVSHSTFINNTNTVGSGSAISVDTSHMYVTKCAFLNQHANTDGGAIFVNDGGLIVNGSIMHGNTAGASGGAIAARRSSLVVRHTEVTHNSAGVLGGGGVACSACPTAILHDSKFINNTSQGGGGVFQADADTQAVSLEHVEATGNRAVSGGVLHINGEASSLGPGTSNGQGIVYIADSTFRDNHANEAVGEADNHSTPSLAASPTYSALQGSGGAITFVGAVLWLQHSAFHSNTASVLGGAMMLEPSCTPGNQLYTPASSFDEHQTLLSGMYHAWQAEELKSSAQNHSCSTVVLVNTAFTNNIAQGAGGAIYSTSPQGLQTQCPDDSRTDWGPYAFSGLHIPSSGLPGDANDIAREVPELCSAWAASGNQSPGYGNVIAFPAKRLQVRCRAATMDQKYSTYACAEETGEQLMNITGFWSTDAVDEVTGELLARVLLDVLALDHLNQTVTVDYPTGTSLQVQANSSVQNILSGQYSSGVAVAAERATSNASFTGLLLKAPPGHYTITFHAINHLESVTSSTVAISVRNCLPGEVTGGGADDTCNRCPAGQFSFSPSNATCDSPCPSSANCTSTSELLSLPGHWHSGPQATLIHPCPNPKACQGDRLEMQRCWLAASLEGQGQQQPLTVPCNLRPGCNWTVASAAAKYLDWQCSEGYQDRLCSVCQEGYGASGHFSCTKCSSLSASIAQYVLLLVGLLGLNGFLIAQLSKATMTDFAMPQGSDYLQAFLVYMQLLSILATLNGEWPPVLAGLLTASGYLTNLAPQVVPLDCLVHYTGLPVHVSRTIVQMCVPIAMMLLFMLLFSLAHFFKKSASDPRWLIRHISITAFSVTGFFYPSLAQASLNIFSCYSIDHPVPADLVYRDSLQATWRHGYWVLAMGTRCFHGWHLTFTLTAGLLGVLLFCVGIPLASLLLLSWKVYVNRDSLDSARVIAHVGFLYRSYNYREGGWWEGSAVQVKMTLLLLVVVIGRPLGTYIQSLILVAMLVSELVYLCIRRPIRFPRVWWLQLATIAILTLSLLVSLFASDFQSKASPRGLEALGILAAVVNLALCLLFVWYIGLGYKESVQKLLLRSKQFLAKSSSRLQGLRHSVTGRLASLGGRQASCDPMLLSGSTSPSKTSSTEVSDSTSSCSPEAHKAPSALSSKQLAESGTKHHTLRG